MAGEADFEKAAKDAEKALREVALAARTVPEARRAVEEGLKLVTAARNAQQQKRFTVAFERLTAARGKALEAEGAKALGGKTPPVELVAAPPIVPESKVKPVPVQGVSAARGTYPALIQEGKALRGLAEQALQKGETGKALELIGKAEQIEALARGRLNFFKRMAAEVLVQIRKHPLASVFGAAAGLFAVYIGKLTSFPAFIFEETSQQAAGNLWGFTDKAVLEKMRDPKTPEREYAEWEAGAEKAMDLLKESATAQDEFNATPWMWVAPPARASYLQFAKSTWGRYDSNRYTIDQVKKAREEAKRAAAAKGKAAAQAPSLEEPSSAPSGAAQPAPAQESKGPAQAPPGPTPAAPRDGFTGSGTFSPEELHAYTALPEEDRERYRSLDTKGKHEFRKYLHQYGTAPPK